jgi:hypothetical protein
LGKLDKIRTKRLLAQRKTVVCGQGNGYAGGLTERGEVASKPIQAGGNRLIDDFEALDPRFAPVAQLVPVRHYDQKEDGNEREE